MCIPTIGAQPGGGKCPPRKFQNIPQQFDICRNFQRIKTKFCIVIIFKKKVLFEIFFVLLVNYLLTRFIRPSDRIFRKWLVFNHKYAGSVKTWEIMLVFLRHFLSFCSCTTFFWDRPHCDLMNFITLLLNRANCWNFQSDKRNLDMLVVMWPRQTACSSTIFWLFSLRAKRITISNVVHFLKTLYSCIFGSKPDSFQLYFTF